MLFDGLEFAQLKHEDIPILTPIMKRAFDDDSRLYFPIPVGGPVGYDDGSFLEKWGLDPKATAFRINMDGEAIGAMTLLLDYEDNSGVLVNLFIDSTLIGKGYGSTAWRFAENTYPQITMWETETPAVSYRNHSFYINKCGFSVYAVDGERDRFQARFKLRKIMTSKPQYDRGDCP